MGRITAESDTPKRIADEMIHPGAILVPIAIVLSNVVNIRVGKTNQIKTRMEKNVVVALLQPSSNQLKGK